MKRNNIYRIPLDGCFCIFFSKLDSIQTLKSTLSWFETNDPIMKITRVMMSLSKMQEKHLWRSDTFDKVVGIWPATLHRLLLLHKFFPCIGANQLNLIRNNTIWKIFRALVSPGTLICMIVRYWFWFPLSFNLLKMKFTLQVNEKRFLHINFTLVLKAGQNPVQGDVSFPACSI